MLKGIQLTLMAGPVIAVPVSREIVEALESVEVSIKDTGTSGFQLEFTLGKNSILQTIFLLSGGSSLSLLRVILLATVNGTPEVLIDGVVTKHEVKPGANGGPSKLSITGEDLTAVMNQDLLVGLPFPAMPAEARVALLLLKYAVFGVIPLVIPSIMIDVPLPTGEIPHQQGTDLQYIRALAERVGYVFYIEAGPEPGVNKAYWGPQIKVGVPQPALNVDSDAYTNVDSLSFSFDNQKNKIPSVMHHEEKTGITLEIPVPPITPLSPPLGLLPPIPTGLQRLEHGLAKFSIPRKIMYGMAKGAQMAEAVTGTGSLNVLRYGRILKARGLVGVRGAGQAFDGLHYVKSVTHQIKRGEYKQSFSLTRNGLISTVPRVF
jgi:hypothetical protein